MFAVCSFDWQEQETVVGNYCWCYMRVKEGFKHLGKNWTHDETVQQVQNILQF